MADKNFDRLRRFNFKTFRSLSRSGKMRISKFYDFVLGASKKYNLMRFYKKKANKK